MKYFIILVCFTLIFISCGRKEIFRVYKNGVIEAEKYFVNAHDNSNFKIVWYDSTGKKNSMQVWRKNAFNYEIQYYNDKVIYKSKMPVDTVGFTKANGDQFYIPYNATFKKWNEKGELIEKGIRKNNTIAYRLFYENVKLKFTDTIYIDGRLTQAPKEYWHF